MDYLLAEVADHIGTKESFAQAVVDLALMLGYTYTEVYPAVEILRAIDQKRTQASIAALVGTSL